MNQTGHKWQLGIFFILVSLVFIEVSAASTKAHQNDIDKRSIFEHSSLMKAAQESDLAMIKNLLTRGADANYKNQFGQTALSMALESEQPANTASLLIPYMDQESLNCFDIIEEKTILVLTLKKGLIPTAKEMIAHGSNPKTTDRAGRTPLFYVCNKALTPFFPCKSKSVDPAMQLLLECGVSPNIMVFENSALMSAIKGGYVQNALLLIKHGATPNSNDDETQETPLISAVQLGNITLIESLLRAGAHPDDIVKPTPNSGNEIRLNALSYTQNENIIRTLLMYGTTPRQDNIVSKKRVMSIYNGLNRANVPTALQELIVQMGQGDAALYYYKQCLNHK